MSLSGYGSRIGTAIHRKLEDTIEESGVTKIRAMEEQARGFRKAQKDLNKKIQAAKDNLAKWGDEPEVGTSVVFQRTFEGLKVNIIYTYAAVRTPIGWFITGRQSSLPMKWEELIEFIGDGSAKISTDYRYVQ